VPREVLHVVLTSGGSSSSSCQPFRQRLSAPAFCPVVNSHHGSGAPLSHPRCCCGHVRIDRASHSHSRVTLKPKLVPWVRARSRSRSNPYHAVALLDGTGLGFTRWPASPSALLNVKVRVVACSLYRHHRTTSIHCPVIFSNIRRHFELSNLIAGCGSTQYHACVKICEALDGKQDEQAVLNAHWRVNVH